jgi:hypothetical protein
MTSSVEPNRRVVTITPADTGEVLVNPGMGQGSRLGTPRIALPLRDGDGQRRYRIGEIKEAQ